jgi:acetyltransferase
VGLGGVFVEVLKDVVSFLPPVDAAAAIAYLRRLKGYKLLDGARGRAPADHAALGEAIARFSLLATMLGRDIAEMDLNPIIAGPRGAWAVDALVVPALASVDPAPYRRRHELPEKEAPPR